LQQEKSWVPGTVQITVGGHTSHNATAHVQPVLLPKVHTPHTHAQPHLTRNAPTVFAKPMLWLRDISQSMATHVCSNRLMYIKTSQYRIKYEPLSNYQIYAVQ